MRSGQLGLLALLGGAGAMVGFLTGGALLGPESRLTVAIVGALVGALLARALWITRPRRPAPPAGRPIAPQGPTDNAPTAPRRTGTARAQRRREQEARRRDGIDGEGG